MVGNRRFLMAARFVLAGGEGSLDPDGGASRGWIGRSKFDSRRRRRTLESSCRAAPAGRSLLGLPFLALLGSGWARWASEHIAVPRLFQLLDALDDGSNIRCGDAGRHVSRRTSGSPMHMVHETAREKRIDLRCHHPGSRRLGTRLGSRFRTPTANRSSAGSRPLREKRSRQISIRLAARRARHAPAHRPLHGRLPAKNGPAA